MLVYQKVSEFIINPFSLVHPSTEHPGNRGLVRKVNAGVFSIKGMGSAPQNSKIQWSIIILLYFAADNIYRNHFTGKSW